MAKRAKTQQRKIQQYDHKDKTRANNPPVGLVTRLPEPFWAKWVIPPQFSCKIPSFFPCAHQPGSPPSPPRAQASTNVGAPDVGATVALSPPARLAPFPWASRRSPRSPRCRPVPPSAFSLWRFPFFLPPSSAHCSPPPAHCLPPPRLPVPAGVLTYVHTVIESGFRRLASVAGP